MNNKRKWTAVGAASALGLGLVAGGGVMAANAMTIHDTSGEQVGTDKASTDTSNSIIQSATSAPDAPITTTSTPATTSAATQGASAVSPVTAVSAQTAVSAPTAVSAQTAVSTVSPASAVSVQSANSPASAQSAD